MSDKIVNFYDKLGIKGISQLSIPFKLAFNTLLYKN